MVDIDSRAMTEADSSFGSGISVDYLGQVWFGIDSGVEARDIGGPRQFSAKEWEYLTDLMRALNGEAPEEEKHIALNDTRLSESDHIIRGVWAACYEVDMHVGWDVFVDSDGDLWVYDTSQPKLTSPSRFLTLSEVEAVFDEVRRQHAGY